MPVSDAVATSRQEGASLPQKGEAILHVLIALTAVIAVGRALGWVFSHVGQPPVIGEVLGGILLGPSLLGRITPAAAEFVLPPSVAPSWASSPSSA